MKQQWWRAAAIVSAVAAMAGCAGSGAPRGTAAIVQVQTDGGQRQSFVSFAPQTAACGTLAHCPMLGAQWNSATPGRAILLVGTRDGQRKVSSVEFNARPHAPLRVRTLAREGSGLEGVTAFIVPMDTLERVAFGRDAWVRLTTDRGVVEELLHNGEQSSHASDALKRLVYEVYKGSDKELPTGLSGLFGADKPYQPNYDK